MELFSVFGRILLQDDGVEDKLTSVSKKAEETEGRFSGVFKRISASALQLGSTLVNALKEVFSEAVKSQNALTDMDTILKSMKDASSITQKGFNDLAESQNKLTLYSKISDEALKNLLLTFKNIDSLIINEALPAINKMSIAIGSDMESSAILLGKALNDPVNGITILSEAGVKFTEQEKAQTQAMAAAGDTAGAQKKILQELEKEFGITASVSGNTLGGQIISLKNNLVDFGGGVYDSVITPFKQADDKIKNFVNGVEDAYNRVTGVQKKIEDGLGTVKKSLSSLNKREDKDASDDKNKKSGTGKDKISKKMSLPFSGTLDKFADLSVFKKLNSGYETVALKCMYGMDNVNNKLSGFSKDVKSKFSGITNKIPDELKSKFHNATKGISDEMPKIKSAFSALGKNVAGGLKSMTGMAFKIIGPAAMIGTLLVGLGVVQQKFGPQIDKIAQQLIKKGPGIINDFIKGITTKIPALMAQGTQLVQTLLKVIIANAPALIKGAAELIASLVNGISKNIPKLIPIVLQLIQTILIAIVNNLPTILMAGLKLLIALAQGIANNISKIVATIVNVITQIIKVLIQNMPLIIDAGIKILVALIQGVCKAIPQLIAAIPQIVSAIWNGLKNVNWGSLGSAILNGIIEGLKAAVKGIWGVIKSVAGDIMSGFKSIFGIHSPSTLMRDEIGKFIPAGIGEGIEQNTQTALSSIDNMSKKMINGIGKNKAGIVNAAKGLSDMNLGVSLNTKNALKTNRLKNSEAENTAVINKSGSSNSGLTLMIENFYNNRKEDIKELAEELQFYYEQCSKGKGGLVNV